MKTILITGASSGIGAEAALELAAPDLKLVLVARRVERLAAIASECEAKGAHVTVLPLDLTDAHSISALADSVGDSKDLSVVLNAGFAEFGSFHEQIPSQIDHAVDLMLKSPMKLVQAVLPQMLSSGTGHLVFVLSIAAKHDFPGAAIYSSVKGGLDSFASSLHEEVRRKGIRVTRLYPGAVDTEIWTSGGPPRDKMIPARDVGSAIAWILHAPAGASIDEVTLMPRDGIL